MLAFNIEVAFLTCPVRFDGSRRGVQAFWFQAALGRRLMTQGDRAVTLVLSLGTGPSFLPGGAPAGFSGLLTLRLRALGVPGGGVGRERFSWLGVRAFFRVGHPRSSQANCCFVFAR